MYDDSVFLGGRADKMMYYLLAASQVVKRKGCRGTMGAPPSDSAEKNSALSCNTTKSL